MKNLSLNFKIGLVISIFVTALVTVSGVGIVKVMAINDSLNYLVDGVAQRQTIALSMDAITNEIKNQEKRLILEETKEGMEDIAKQLDSLEAELKEDIAKLKELNTPAIEKYVSEIPEKLVAWKEFNLEIRKHAYAGDNKEAYQVANKKSAPALRQVDERITEIVSIAKENMHIASKDTDTLVENSRILIIFTSIVALLLGISVAVLIMRAVSKAIDQVISSLDDSSNQVAAASQQIAATSEELSQSTTEQASSLEETAASVEEMNSMISKNSENARQASDTSSRSHQNANKGKQTVELMIQSIGEINEANANIMQQINHSNSQISEIVQVIAEIGNKTKVINDIVFQTKLLSFNASVEAARAGEHGKGFAVVAEEVGNLAEMSGNAAKEISAMLEGSIQKVEGIVKDTKSSVETLVAEGKKKVETGTKIAHDCGEVLEEIVQSISSVAQMSGEISSASQEQAQGIGEITKAMAQLDQVTQQNSAASEEAASAAEELSAQAETLKSGVHVLIETIRGANGKVNSQHEIGTAPRASRQKSSSKTTSVANAPSGRTPSNVVHIRRKADQGAAPVATFKKASGDDSVPSYDDDRFKDV